MTTLIKMFLLILAGIIIGMAWQAYHYNPIIKDQEQKIEALSKAYTKLISKHFIVPFKRENDG